MQISTRVGVVQAMVAFLFHTVLIGDRLRPPPT
jgi:hypothetical protein